MSAPDDLDRRAHALFVRAMEASEQSRAEFVRGECGGDADLEARVRSLLEAARRSSAFLEVPALGGDGSGEHAIPDAVGSYLVVGVLGSGGMATVYEALQERPRRRVALKVLHQGLVGSEAYARFRFEGEILARLRHPGIAPIYEAGTARLGHGAAVPFFAMELVADAATITDHVRRRAMGLRARVEMAALVCDAVHYGHQQGVIHRDIKPANVLVDGEGRARVIDFGIARVVEAHGAPLTASAGGSSLVGTLNAMSPEQCSDPAGVDVRTDVYSLGVMLYELVSGVPPHDLSGESMPSAIRKIVEEPAAPLGSRCREARGDLEAIVAKAMAKDRERRYSIAGELAADLRRYLAGQAVTARPETLGERVWRFSRRNKPLAAAMGLSGVLLVGGVVVSSVFAFRASRARDAALERERDLEVVTEFQESLLRDVDMQLLGETLSQSICSSIARSAALESDAAVAESLRGWDALLPRVNFTSVAIASFKESVLDRYGASIRANFADRPVLRARLLQRLAGTMHSLGLHGDAEPLLREAFEARRSALGPEHEDTLQTRHALGALLLTLGRYEESLALVRGAYDASRRLAGPDATVTLRYGTTLGGVYRRLGRLDDAEAVWSDTLARRRRVTGEDDAETLRVLNNMGVLHAVRGDAERAESCWRELIDRRRALGVDHPDYRGSLGNLAVLLQDQGRLVEARGLFELELESNRRQQGDTSVDSLRSMARLASVLLEMGELPTAEALGRQCWNGRREVLGTEHEDTLAAAVLLGQVLTARGSPGEAEPILREAHSAQRGRIGESHPGTLEAVVSLAGALLEMGRVEESQRLTCEAISSSSDRDTTGMESLGILLSAQGAELARAGCTEDARAALVRGHALLERTMGATHPRTRRAAARMVAFLEGAPSGEPSEDRARELDAWRARSGLVRTGAGAPR